MPKTEESSSMASAFASWFSAWQRAAIGAVAAAMVAGIVAWLADVSSEAKKYREEAGVWQELFKDDLEILRGRMVALESTAEIINSVMDDFGVRLTAVAQATLDARMDHSTEERLTKLELQLQQVEFALQNQGLVDPAPFFDEGRQ